MATPNPNVYNGVEFSTVKNENTGFSNAELLQRATKLLTPKTDTPPTSGFNYNYNPSEEDALIAKLKAEAGVDAGQTIDEDKIRRDTLKLFRTEIDATNNIYNDIVNRQEFTNANNEGGLRAVQNRQGLIGSGMGMSQTQQQRDLGQQAIGTIQAERQTKISTIMGKARQEALDEITARRTAQSAGATNYLSYVELGDERKAKRVANVLSAFINQGIDPSEMSPQELNEIAKTIGANPDEIMSGYSEATKATREKEQASTREASIAQLIKSGVTDPNQLFDYLNYDESGKKVGDITLAEIGAVQKALREGEDTFNLSEGQARYRRKPDGTYELIAERKKTYAPKETDDTTDTSNKPTFEEFVAMREEEEQQTFRPEYRDTEIKAEYDALYGNNVSGDFKKFLTSTDKQEIASAGLAEDDAKVYLINTEPAFRQYYLQGVATGEIPQGAGVDDIDALYEEWYTTKETDSSDPFANMTSAQMLEELNR